MNQSQDSALFPLITTHWPRKLVLALMIGALVIGVSWSATEAALQPVTVVVAATGDKPARGSGTLSELETPVLSNNGQAAFVGTLRNNGSLVGNGLFRNDGSTRSAEVLLLQGDGAPDFNGNVGAINNPPLFINGHGEVALQLNLVGTLGGGQDAGVVFRCGVTNALVARAGDLVPGGGRISTYFNANLALNDADQVVFSAFLRNTTGVFDNQGLFRGDGTNLVQIVRLSGQAPNNSGTFIGLTQVAPGVGMNEAGQVLFVGLLQSAGGGIGGSGLFLGDGINLGTVARTGDPAPSGNGTFNLLQLAKPALNNRGEAAFVTTLANTALGAADSSGVFRIGTGGGVEVARKGGLTPNNRGRFLDFGADVMVNDAGAVLFFASVTGAPDNSGAGMFLGNGTNVTAVARVGDAAPGGGKFAIFNTTMFSLNAAGQVVFSATLTPDAGTTGGATGGLFFYDPVLGLFPIARLGDGLADRGAISQILFLGGLGPGGRENSGLNDHGQVAFRCFAGGDAVVALWGLKEIGDNHPPVSTGFAALASQGQTLQLAVSTLLSVVTDPEGGLLSLTSITNKSVQGGVIGRSGQQVSYTPPFNFRGADQFSYVVQDNVGLTVAVTAVITVTGPNRFPVLASGRTGLNFIVQAGQAVTVSVADLLAVATDPDGDVLTLAALPSATGRGGVITRVDEQITVTPALDTGTDSFGYMVLDGRGGSLTILVQFSAASGLSSLQVKPTEVIFSLTGAAGTWDIERCASLPGPWTKIGQLTNTGGIRRIGNSTVEFHDPAPLPGRAFFRASTTNSGPPR